jgi:glycosyltransferase involved in cell wall biosynthesis
MKDIKISAIVTTRNRVEYLKKALKGLTEQTLQQDRFEILVVDNASTDDTRKTVLDMLPVLSNLQYIYEPVLGLTHARNTGWKAARGRYIAFLDDDAIPFPQWLEKIVESFETVMPSPGCVGGKIHPIWESPRPSWLNDNLARCLTILDWSDTPFFIEQPKYVAGANIAFPRDLIEQVKGFKPDLGRVGKKLLSNEEILLSRQIEKMGFKTYYHPDIAVYHHIPASRISKLWFMRRHYWQGVSDAVTMRHLASPSFISRLRMAAAKAKALFFSPKALASIFSDTNDPLQFQQKCSVFYTFGCLRGLL